MKLIVGLGNPGNEFAVTRHNAGFMVLDALAQQPGSKLKWQDKPKFFSEICQIGDWLLVKPQTFMNESGKAIQACLQFYKIANTDLWVIHDDLDLELGKYKIQKGTGPKVHNGLDSIYQTLGTKDFWHVRVGVDSRQGDRTLPGHVYVLQALPTAELGMLHQTSQTIAADLVARLK